MSNKKSTKVEEVSFDVSERAETATTPPEPGVPAAAGPQIYLGPNIPGGRLLQSTVFRNAIPAYLQPLIQEQPDIGALIVPVSDMADVQNRIVQTGTAEYVAYQNLLQGGVSNGI
ncbi:hypothetical protein [Cohnella nanjingensis]|uniref:Uncharacterized protein n=1 Tax=Cohnella nanjingensis TaxID=1387779 RepID=A0A7X0RN19_9BACL|nr:hypothetical protein [Cohnella nanjingensis]MBB6670502.1 hypothetical protein [Cohnella nanjingensis]